MFFEGNRYLDFNTMHTLHGRAVAFATGVKLARPDLKVVAMVEMVIC